VLSLGSLDFVDRLRIAAEKKPTVLPRQVFGFQKLSWPKPAGDQKA
jgi:hypothetical protein